MENIDIILASASPRRQELLKNITENFTVVVSDTDEVIPENISVSDAPQLLAMRKAQAVALKHPQSLVIGADTVVILGDVILGKPKTREEAFNMLSMLSGKTHSVITGCALVLGDKSISFSVLTEVEFYPLSTEEINEYINTSEPYDKAGGYGIQGKGSLLVKKIDGDYFNVVGLPIAKLKRVMCSFYNLIKK